MLGLIWTHKLWVMKHIIYDWYDTVIRESKLDFALENPWQVNSEIFSSFSSIIIFHFPTLVIISVIFVKSITWPSIFIESFICWNEKILRQLYRDSNRKKLELLNHNKPVFWTEGLKVWDLVPSNKTGRSPRTSLKRSCQWNI